MDLCPLPNPDDQGRAGDRFGIFMIRAALSGLGDEIIDLAKTNRWR